uniref:kunitz trypsin inhibitor 5-like n=1 Tax=Erigeron canadensis TaxID=72917 RepID=UPI001CB8EF57|nr:kunitz trypsin inhibitor 5-like [Erigeron canadensis]
MKMIFYILSLISFIILTTTFPPLATASDVIYDSAGNKLLRGIPYFILPLLRGTSGGLTLSRSRKDACPLDVTQEPFELNFGVPFTFTPIVLDEDYVHASYPVSIEADVADPCKGSNILKVSTTAELSAVVKKLVGSPPGTKTITTGGEFNTPESCFQFVEDDVMPGLRSYQIQLCPFKCGSNSTTSSLTCYNIGITPDESGKGFLSLTDAMFPVVFSNTFSKPVQSQ